MNVLVLSWHSEEGALVAGGHRRTLRLLDHFSRMGRLIIVDNSPTMFRGVPVDEYRPPTVDWLARLDRRFARLVQWASAGVLLFWHGLRAIRRDSVDVVYVPNSEILPCCLAGVVLKLLTRRPLVLCNMNVGGVFLAPIVARLHGVADRVIVLSAGHASELAHRGVRRHVDVVGCGAPDLAEPPPSRGPNDEHALDAEWDGIYIGRHTIPKGILDTLDIWERVLDRRPHARLALIGSCAPEIERIVAARRSASPRFAASVHLLGVVSDAVKLHHLAAARVLVFPSRNEGWGFVPVEALLHGVPVVCWDLAAYSASLPEGPAVVRVPAHDLDRFVQAVLQLLELCDSSRRALVARSAVEFPTWEAIAAAEWSVLAEAADAR